MYVVFVFESTADGELSVGYISLTYGNTYTINLLTIQFLKVILCNVKGKI